MRELQSLILIRTAVLNQAWQIYRWWLVYYGSQVEGPCLDPPVKGRNQYRVGWWLTEGVVSTYLSVSRSYLLSSAADIQKITPLSKEKNLTCIYIYIYVTVGSHFPNMLQALHFRPSYNYADARLWRGFLGETLWQWRLKGSPLRSFIPSRRMFWRENGNTSIIRCPGAHVRAKICSIIWIFSCL